MRRAIAILALLGASPALGADFYVDPANGSMANDGSLEHPWSTLAEVVAAGKIETRDWDTHPYAAGATLVVRNAGAPVKAGDTIWLRSGYHGSVTIESAYNAAPITIAAAPGAQPRLKNLLLRSVQHWVVRGLSVSPSHAPAYEAVTMIDVEDHGWHGPSFDVVIEDCELFSVADASGWTDVDWNDKAANGIMADGERTILRRNSLRNVDFGIALSGKDALAERNTVENFAGDGLRGLGDHQTFQYNLVKNCYAVNANHDDGFQSWSTGAGGVGTGEVTGITLRGNVFINYTDPAQPYRGTLQGIGCFDGFFVDWVVENNVIITDHWHGITFLGMRGGRIVNNTVIDLNADDPGPPWIRVAEHKDGTASSGVVVRNNVATAYSLQSGLTADHNADIDMTDLATWFVNPAANDLHLEAGSPGIDQGSADLAPAADLEGVPRPQGAAVDQGAYEYHVGPILDAAVPPVDGGGEPDVDGAPAAVDAPATAGDAGGGGAGEVSGCGCRTGRSPATGGAWLAALAGLAAVRRRRERQHWRGPSGARNSFACHQAPPGYELD